MRPTTMATLATEAGFTASEILPTEHPFFRFYRLVPYMPGTLLLDGGRTTR